MAKLLKWLDKYLLEIGITVLLILIPLYPKLPVFDITHTWVYIRLEDFLVALVAGIWLIQLARNKVSLKTPLSFPVLTYWFAGGISLLYAVFILGSQIAHFFPHLAVLHYLRRIEYMVLFFIAASTIKNLKSVKRYLLVIGLTFLVVCLYGLGQKFLGLPAFLTMNEEFAKGVPLRLPPTARMASTFAGHYDLAAYLVLMIVLFASLIFGVKNRLMKILVFLLAFLGFVSLLFTASRISFAVYLIAIALVLFLHKKKWLIIPVIVISLLMMHYLTGASERFGKTLRVERVVYDVRTGRPIATVEEFLAAPTPEPEEPEEPKKPKVIVGPSVPGESLPLGSGFLSLPIIGQEEKEVQVFKKPIITRPLTTATLPSEIATVSGEFLVKRVIVYDISFTTRFQAEWPRAVKVFKRNYLLGSGYSSVSIATDNDYLRLLAETGLLGFFTFIGILAAFGLLIRQGLRRIASPLIKSVLIGVFAGMVGLLLNATLIDVFEASKVAFTFWLLMGIAVGLIQFSLPKRRSLFKEALAVARWPITSLIVFGLLASLLLRSSMINYFTGDDFTWLRWAVTSKLTDIPHYFLDAQGFFYRPLTKVYFYLVHPFLGLRPQGYHFVNFALHLGCAVGAYFLALLITKKKLVSSLAGLLFLVHPVNAETVLWISSTSALMAKFFYIWGFLSYIRWRTLSQKWRHLFLILTILAFILGLCSHELVITFPLMLLFYDFVFGYFQKSGKWLKQIVKYLPFWALASAYLWLRNIIAQAHGLSGDYNYSLKNLPFNFAGNLFGYLGELIAGFHFIPIYDLTRSYLRSHKLLALGLFVVGLVAMIKVIRKIRLTKPIIFSLGWLIILLLPFLGLGNIAERYVYPAHLGFFILVSLFVSWLYQRLNKRNTLFALGLIIVIVGGMLGFYAYEFEKTKRDWYQAGETANKILLALGSNYEEFPWDSTLYFVNLPIRQGRAWVFPVGLEDGLWFIYRDETLIVNRVTDLEETFDLTEGVPNTFVFVYEEGELKKATR